MAAYDPARWSDFALAQLGASAAVLDLVFVALSINLRAVVGSGVLAAYVSALTNAWVLLVEVLR
jgi:hypothetical protein